nr:Arm DNA-binding domain-containing protein [Verticiella sp. GG226]
MTLSDLTVRQAKAAEKTYSIPDTDGLGLVVARTGGKSWHLRYYCWRASRTDPLSAVMRG